MSAPSLEGTWELIRAELGGEAAPQMLAHNITLELAAGEYTVRFAGEIADRGTYTPDPAPGINRLTLTGVEGPSAGRTIPCIYQLAGDRLRVCYGLDGRVPTAFATSTGQQHYLASYRRRAG